MNTATTIAISAAAFIFYSLLRKGQALGQLVFHPHSIKGIKMDGITPVMTLGLAIQNTSNQSFTLKSIAGELWANNYLVGNIASFDPQTINANSEAVVYIKARMSLLGLVSDIINAIKNKTWKQTLELNSVANIDNLQVPIDIKYKF